MLIDALESYEGQTTQSYSDTMIIDFFWATAEDNGVRPAQSVNGTNINGTDINDCSSGAY